MADTRDKLYLSSHLMAKTDPISETLCVHISRWWKMSKIISRFDVKQVINTKVADTVKTITQTGKL